MRAVLAAVLWALAASGFAAGDAERGAKLHQSCLQCHGTELYVPPKAKVKSLKALRKETGRWADYYNPKLSKRELDDLVAWLNREFYRFPDQ